MSLIPERLTAASLFLEDGICHHELVSIQILPGHPPEKGMKSFNCHAASPRQLDSLLSVEQNSFKPTNVNIYFNFEV